nr:hypothetical protein CFP56_38192 [Quercus suber]
MVQVNLDKPLINTIQIGQMVQMVQYEGLNSLCFACGHIGHRKESCAYLIREQPAQDYYKVMPNSASPSLELSEVIPSSTSEDKIYGVWMVVSRRKGKAWQMTPSLTLEKSFSGLHSYHGVVREGYDGGLVEHLSLNKGKQAAGFPSDNKRGMDLDSESMVAVHHRSSSPPSHSSE